MQSPDGQKVKYFMTEKSPNIGWSERSSLHSDSSQGNDLNLMAPTPVLFSDVIARTKARMASDFSRYSATNNCQVYVVNVVQSIYESGGSVIPQDVHRFIWQDAEPLLNSASKATANVVTGLSHAINRLMGKGNKRKHIKFDLRHNRVRRMSK